MNTLINLARTHSHPARLPSNISGACLRLLYRQPFKQYTRTCAEDETPRCLPEYLAKKPCPKMPDAIDFNFELCCPNPCRQALPRFDDLYYKESDKNRQYDQTWVECPELKIKPKEMCCFDKLSHPPMEKRIIRPGTACAVNPCLTGNKKCLKINLPRCKKQREPPKCFVVKAPSGCKKRCTKYPSFSECQRKLPKPLRPVECKCLMVGPACSYR